ncbi:MAG: glycosyltransferase, partial [Thermoanaerobaculia bacterium]
CAFFSSSRLTLNVTRRDMAEMGYCPSGRLFEAAACGTAVLSDTWEGLDRFFEPGREVFTAGSTEEVFDVLSLPREEVLRVARAARERTLAEHTAEKRAAEMVEHMRVGVSA